MSLFHQDPAEDFLLKSTQVLCSPPRTSWPPRRPAPAGPGPSSSSTSLIPVSLISKDRKTTKYHELPAPVALHAPSSSMSAAFDPLRRIPSPEESDEWRRGKQSAARDKRRQEFLRGAEGGEVYDLDEEVRVGKGKGKAKALPGSSSKPLTTPSTTIDLTTHDDEAGLEEDEVSDDESDTDKELCVICLQGLRDRTVLGECGHQGFCFQCINVWANQSRRCPLCSAPMSQFLLHDLDSPVGPSKFYLPPLPTIRPPNPQPSTFTSTLPHRPLLAPFRPRGEVLFSDRPGAKGVDVWAETRGQREREEDELERMVERRRAVYRDGLFAKHIASNIHTRYKPTPTPRQFAENPEMVARATAFLRRELRVWRSVDVEFLTTYIISLMRSIDIRSEPAVRLLSDFLDAPGLVGRERRGAEHFAHEVYSFLRSPYRDLAVYDAIVQYDPVPSNLESSSSAAAAAKPAASILVSGRKEIGEDDMDVDVPADVGPSRGRSVSGRDRSLSPSLSRSRSRSPLSRVSRSRSRSPSRARPSRPKLSPKRWDRWDSYVPVYSPPPRLGHSRSRSRSRSPGRDWTRKDSWVNPKVEAERRKNQDEVRRIREEKRREKEERLGEKRDILVGLGAEAASVTGVGMRGWDESVSETVVEVALPSEADSSASELQPHPQPLQPSLALRIFGASQIGRKASPSHRLPSLDPRSRARTPDRAPSSVPPSSALDDAALDDYIWGPDSEIELDVLKAQEERAEEVRRLARKERLLGKLLREKRMSARREREAAAAREEEERRVAEEEAGKAEAKARARLRLKMKLNKEKKSVPVVAEVPMEIVVDVAEEQEDKAAALKAKLMERRRAKEAAMGVTVNA